MWRNAKRWWSLSVRLHQLARVVPAITAFPISPSRSPWNCDKRSQVILYSWGALDRELGSVPKYNPRIPTNSDKSIRMSFLAKITMWQSLIRISSRKWLTLEEASVVFSPLLQKSKPRMTYNSKLAISPKKPLEARKPYRAKNSRFREVIKWLWRWNNKWARTYNKYLSPQI